MLEPLLIDGLELAVDGGHGVGAARMVVGDGHLSEDAPGFERLDDAVIDLDVDAPLEHDVHLLCLFATSEDDLSGRYGTRLGRILEDLEYVHEPLRQHDSHGLAFVRSSPVTEFALVSMAHEKVKCVGQPGRS